MQGNTKLLNSSMLLNVLHFGIWTQMVNKIHTFIVQNQIASDKISESVIKKKNIEMQKRLPKYFFFCIGNQY